MDRIILSIVQREEKKIMKLIMKPPQELIEYENNPRDYRDAVESVKRSIREFGFQVPVLIDKENVIVAGHVRCRAAKELEIKQIPCITVEGLTEGQIKAFRLVDNKTSEMASWDMEKLMEELSGLAAEGIELSEFHFPELEGAELEVNDEDFLQETELKGKAPKTMKCPQCGHEFTI